MLKPSYFGYYNRYFISLQVYNRYQQSFLFSSGLASLPSYTRNIWQRTQNYHFFYRGLDILVRSRICPRTLNYLYLYAAQIYGHVPVHARERRIICAFTPGTSCVFQLVPSFRFVGSHSPFASVQFPSYYLISFISYIILFLLFHLWQVNKGRLWPFYF